MVAWRRIDLVLKAGAFLTELEVGAELGGGFEYAHTKLGSGIETRGRYLLAPQKSAFDERGGSPTLGLDPGAENVAGGCRSRRSKERKRAKSNSSGAARRCCAPVRRRTRIPRRTWRRTRVELDVGYGLVTHEGSGLLTTYSGV